MAPSAAAVWFTVLVMFVLPIMFTVTGEVVKAITPTGYCAQAHGIDYLADVVDGKSWIQNADELAGKIVLCQRSTATSASSSVSFAEMNLFVSYAVPTAKALLVMNNMGNSNDGHGLAVMNDGYDTCGQQGDKWGNALRHPDVYRAGCAPLSSLPYSETRCVDPTLTHCRLHSRPVLPLQCTHPLFCIDSHLSVHCFNLSGAPHLCCPS